MPSSDGRARATRRAGRPACADNRRTRRGARTRDQRRAVEFAGNVGKSVAACEAANPAEVAGLAVRVDSGIVGWVVLKRGAAAPDWVGADAAVVSGLRIDARHQGRGLGGAALAALAEWVARHWPQTALLTLRVDDGNAAGIRAYEKAGWVETGERRVGRVGVERTMSLRL